MATPKTVGFHTLGCKLNFSESSSISRKFEEAGYGVIPFGEGPDICVINTCSVTDFADKKCRKSVRQALKRNPGALVIVTGCYAQLKPQEIVNIDGVDLVLGAKEKFNVVDYIDEISAGHTKGIVVSGEIEEVNSFESSFSFGDRTRSFLKIQDGCDYKCTFCTIPQARGKSRSSSVEKVMVDAFEIAQKGVNEIVLTGVNIGDFGNGTEVIEGLRPKKQDLFIDLIRNLDTVSDIERFRISSIEPNLCNEEIIDFVSNSRRFQPHFHIPLQSGSNRILKLMKRRYKKELYADRVAYIRKKVPHACIGVDVIVGFPGESKNDFLDTYEFIKDLDVNYLHVFTYSERSNTPAYDMNSVIPMEVRKERNEMLRILSEKKKNAFYRSYLNTKQKVLIEQSKDKTRLTGFTENYIKINLPYRPNMINTIHDIRLLDIDSNGDVLANWC